MKALKKYNIEDGNFRTGEKGILVGREKQWKSRELKSMKLLYRRGFDKRKYRCGFSRTEMKSTKYASWKERLPKTTEKFAIDRMYADNNSLKIGDTLSSGDKTWKNCRADITVRLQCPLSE